MSNWLVTIVRPGADPELRASQEIVAEIADRKEAEKLAKKITVAVNIWGAGSEYGAAIYVSVLKNRYWVVSRYKTDMAPPKSPSSYEQALRDEPRKPRRSEIDRRHDMLAAKPGATGYQVERKTPKGWRRVSSVLTEENAQSLLEREQEVAAAHRRRRVYRIVRIG